MTESFEAHTTSLSQPNVSVTYENSIAANVHNTAMGSRIYILAITAASAYVLAALSYHTWKKKSRQTEGKVDYLCVFVAVCTQLLCLNKVAEYWIGIHCAFYHWSAAVVYDLGLGSIYTILWLRQRKLYSDLLLAPTINKCARLVSTFIILGIYVLVSLSIFIFMRTYTFSTGPSCVPVWIRPEIIVPLATASISMCFVVQFVLFFLIMRPLVRSKNTTAKLCFAIIKVCGTPKNDIHRMLKRLAYCTVACVASTGLSFAAILVEYSEIYKMKYTIPWPNMIPTDLLLKEIVAVLAFSGWRRRLFPACVKKRRNNDHSLPRSDEANHGGREFTSSTV